MKDTFKDDILQPIQNEDILYLRDQYSKNWPDQITMYYYIDVSYTSIVNNNINIHFYSVNGNLNDGTFIIIDEDIDVINLSYCTLDKTNTRLYKGLSETKRINWNKPINANYIYRDQIPITCELVKKIQLHLSFLITTGYFWLPKEKALEFKIEIPDNTFIGPLSLEHAEKIYKAWPHNDQRPIDYVENLITYYKGIGLFDKSDNTLLAWVMRNNFGLLGMLQTDDKQKRKGYGTVVAKALCKQFAENNIDPTCTIVIGNTTSEKLFKNLGFKRIDYLSWIGIKAE